MIQRISSLGDLDTINSQARVASAMNISPIKELDEEDDEIVISGGNQSSVSKEFALPSLEQLNNSQNSKKKF